jgi:hypothetical protein
MPIYIHVYIHIHIYACACMYVYMYVIVHCTHTHNARSDTATHSIDTLVLTQIADCLVVDLHCSPTARRQVSICMCFLCAHTYIHVCMCAYAHIDHVFMPLLSNHTTTGQCMHVCFVCTYLYSCVYVRVCAYRSCVHATAVQPHHNRSVHACVFV